MGRGGSGLPGVQDAGFTSGEWEASCRGVSQNQAVRDIGVMLGREGRYWVGWWFTLFLGN